MSIVANYRLFLRLKTNVQTLSVLMIAFPKNLHLMLFLSFSVNYAVNSIKKCVRQLNVRIWKHTVISLLTRKEVKPKGSCNSDYFFATIHHLLIVLKLKESLLIMRDKQTN